MSMDPSLKSGGGMGRHRNVLTRAERVAYLADKGEFSMDDGNPVGLRKVANRKIVTGKTKKKKGAEEEAEA